MLCDWVMEYRRHLGLGAYEGNLELEYDTLVQSLFRSIEEAYEKDTMQGPRHRYSLSIEEVGKKYFLKLEVHLVICLILVKICYCY